MLYVVALPLLIFLSFKPKYKKSIPSRFFLYNNPRFKNSGGIWFHVCSLGEARALKPLLDLLDDEDIKITTITQTGQAEAKKYSADVRYLPYETFLPFWAKKQRVLVVLEAEFWYLLFSVMRAKGAKIILLNARISERSAKKYLQFAWFYEKILKTVDTIYAQSQADKNRFLALGAKNIEVIGNIKLASKIVKTKNYEKPKKEFLVAGSTHDGEESAILDAFVRYRVVKNSSLAVVPRHPERFEKVYELMSVYAQKHGLTISRFSQVVNFDADLILVDVMGELNNIYAISDIAILGGAFRDDVGGHNPLEPAFFGCKIVTGTHFFHQRELMKYVFHVQFVEPQEIYKALLECEKLPPCMISQSSDLTPVINKIKEL